MQSFYNYIGLNECLYGTKFIKCDNSYLNNKVSNHLYLIS